MLRRSALSLAAVGGTYGPFTVSMGAPYVAEVTMASRNKLNLMDTAMMDAMHHVFSTVISEEAGDSVRAVVLTTPDADHHFCAGLDLKGTLPLIMGDLTLGSKAKIAVAHTVGADAPQVCEGGGMPAMKAMKLHKNIRKFQDAISSIARCRVPVIAAVNKMCIGGGINIATACDFRYATADSSFSVREARVGIVADIGVLQRLPAIVGEGCARELTFLANDISGTEAHGMRLVNKVFGGYDEMLAAARAAAATIASNSPIAVQGAKEVLNQRTEADVQRSLDYVRVWNSAFLKCDDVVTAGLAFAAKKQPKFSNYVENSTSAFPAAVAAKPPAQ